MRALRPARAGRRGPALIVLAALLTAACGTPIGGVLVDPIDELRSRPTFEESATQNRAMITEIEARVADLVPGLQWEKTNRQDGLSLCEDPFTKTPNARSGVWPGRRTDRPIPDEKWTQVQSAVAAIGARYGFDKVEVLVDKPGQHTVYIHGKWDNHIDFGSIEAASIMVFGHCQLQASPPPTSTPTTSTPTPTATS